MRSQFFIDKIVEQLVEWTNKYAEQQERQEQPPNAGYIKSRSIERIYAGHLV